MSSPRPSRMPSRPIASALRRGSREQPVRQGRVEADPACSLQVVSLLQRTSFTGPDESLIYPPLFSKDGRVANQRPVGACTEFKLDRKSTRMNSSHANISYAVFC